MTGTTSCHTYNSENENSEEQIDQSPSSSMGSSSDNHTIATSLPSSEIFNHNNIPLNPRIRVKEEPKDTYEDVQDLLKRESQLLDVFGTKKIKKEIPNTCETSASNLSDPQEENQAQLHDSNFGTSSQDSEVSDFLQAGCSSENSFGASGGFSAAIETLQEIKTEFEEDEEISETSDSTVQSEPVAVAAPFDPFKKLCRSTNIKHRNSNVEYRPLNSVLVEEDMGHKFRASASARRILLNRDSAKPTKPTRKSTASSVLLRHLKQKTGRTVTPPPEPVPDPLAAVLPEPPTQQKRPRKNDISDDETNSPKDDSPWDDITKKSKRAKKIRDTKSILQVDNPLAEVLDLGETTITATGSKMDVSLVSDSHDTPHRYIDRIRLATASMKERMTVQRLQYIGCKQCFYTIPFHQCHIGDVAAHVEKHLPKRLKGFACRLCGKTIKGPRAHFMRLHPEIFAIEKEFLSANLIVSKRSDRLIADLRGNFEDLLIAALRECFPDHVPRSSDGENVVKKDAADA